MNLQIVSLGLLDPLYTAFGWFMRVLYEAIGNYGLVIIVFTIVLRGLMIPLGIHQQKSSIKQQALAGEVAEIQRQYPKDKAKQNELQMALYKKHGASPLAGCLPAILQLIIIWPIFQIIKSPLQYIMNISAANITEIGNFITPVSKDNIKIIEYLSTHAATLGTVVNKGLMNLNQLLDLNFIGLNLGLTPTYKPALLFGADTLGIYLPLLVFPALAVVTTLIQMKITRLTMPNRKKKAEDKEREKLNPARAGQTPEDKTEGMMKSMNLIMPIFILFTTFTMPAAMGLYWVIGNVMMILQSVLIYFMFTRKLDRAAREASQSA